jgi:hypothetical protein
MRGDSTRAQRVAFSSLAVLSAAMVFAACSSSDVTSSRFVAPAGQGGGGVAGNLVSMGSGGSKSGSDIINVIAPPDDGGRAADVGLSPDAACSGEVHEGQRLPLDMYFIVDVSGSMGEQVQGGTKWKVVSDSLTTFLKDPGNADIGVGIGYFAVSPPACMPGDAGCFCIPFINICFSNSGGSCEVADYAKASIPLSLPPDHGAVVTDIGKHGPGGGTPTRPALEGALQYVTSWTQTNAARKAVVVLATDGEPSGCTSNSPQDVAKVAADALAGAAHIQTFVIGVGKSLTNLNLVAAAGGTTAAFLVDTGGTVSQAFTDALNQIRGQAVSCDFAIPAPTTQGVVDPHLVNVYYTPKGAMDRVPVLMTRGGDPANCGPSGGWYYDDPAAPKTIKLCGTTCESLTGGRVEVEFGCKTIESTVN